MQKTNTILAGLAALLAVPTVYTLIRESETFTDFEKVPYLFDGFTPENVHYIVLSRAKAPAPDKIAGQPTPPDDPNQQPAAVDDEQTQLVFMRKGRRWLLAPPHELAGAPIQVTRVNEDILERMRNIRLEEKTVIQQGATRGDLEAKELTPEKAILISCLNAEQRPIAELYKGKDASAGKVGQDAVRGFFVRLKDGDDILLYEVPFWHLTLRPKDWIERTIHSIKAKDVLAFTVKNDNGEVSFERETGDDPWKVASAPEGSGAVRRQEVDRLLQRFTYVSCDRYLGPINDPSNAEHVPNDKTARIFVSVSLADGTQRSMWVGKKIAQDLGHFAYFEGLSGKTSGMLVAIHDAIPTAFEVDPASLFDPAADQVGPAPDPNQKPAEGSGEKKGK